MKTLLSSGIVGCLSLVLGACGSGEDSAAGDDGEASAAVAADVADAGPALAELKWRSCGDFSDRNVECAELDVPIDYDQPAGEKLPLAMRRILANPLEPYHGALLINPGGPGGAGIDFALGRFSDGIFDAIAPGFDIIGFDPRGVADSGAKGCGILPDDLYPGAAGESPAASELDAYLASTSEEGARCEREWGPLFRELGSNNVVRDMEEIRKALKEPRLNFYGGSYGTRIGALYAHHYPETTGRIVLDAPTHPRASYLELVRGQFYALVALHEQLFVQCESGELVCPPDARALFEQVLVNARGRGYEDLFVSAWRQLFGDAGGVQARVNALAQEAADPGGVWIEAFLVGIFGGRGPGPGFSDVVNASVHCTDDVAPPPTLAEAQSVVAEFTSVSPLFAGVAVGAALCAAWPTTPDPVPMPTALDARPVLVIGGTNDMNTPYPWAPAMAEALGNATLLTSTHVGHGAVIRGGDCVKNVVRAYLTSGSLPPFGAVCN